MTTDSLGPAKAVVLCKDHARRGICRYVCVSVGVCVSCIVFYFCGAGADAILVFTFLYFICWLSFPIYNHSLFTYIITHSLFSRTHSFRQAPSHSLTDSMITDSLIVSFSYSFNCFMHSLTFSVSHSLTPSLTHLLTHSPTLLYLENLRLSIHLCVVQ